MFNGSLKYKTKPFKYKLSPNVDGNFEFENQIMKKYQFRTNINCSGCVAKITPHFSEHQGIESWKVDTDNPKKLLTIETKELGQKEVKEIIEKAGFKAELI